MHIYIMIAKKDDFKFYLKLFYEYKNDQVYKKSFLIRYTKTKYIEKDNYISAGNAQVDDNIILAVDFDGKVGKASNLYFDTTTFKKSEEILKKRKAMNIMPGTTVGFEEKAGKFYLVKNKRFNPIEKWRGCLKLNKKTDDIMADLRGYRIESID